MGNDSLMDDLSMLQDVLDEIVNGRMEGHACPFCGGGPLEVAEVGATTTIRCPGCKKVVQGRFY